MSLYWLVGITLVAGRREIDRQCAIRADLLRQRPSATHTTRLRRRTDVLPDRLRCGDDVLLVEVRPRSS